MSNKIFSTADAAVTSLASANHFGVPVEVESGYILQFCANNSSQAFFTTYTVNTTTGALGADTSTLVTGVTTGNTKGIVLTKSEMFDTDHMLTAFQDATSGNINVIISEWDTATHAVVGHTVTDLGITGGGVSVNFQKIDATHYLLSYDSGTDLIQQVIEINAGTYAVSTVGTPLVTGTTDQAPQSHVVQITSTHYSVSYTKKSPGTSGHFMIVEVNLSTWAVTTATAATDLGGGAATGAYMTTFYLDAVTWTFKVSATKVVVFYNRLDGGIFKSCYRVVDINTGTWAITVGSLQDFQAAGQYMFAAYLTQKDLTVAEAYYSCNVRTYTGQSMWKIGFDAVNNIVTVISTCFNTWTSGSYIRYSPMGHVTEISGGNILLICYRTNTAGDPDFYSIFNADPPTAGGSIKPIASAMTIGVGNSREFPCVISLDSTHFVTVGLVGSNPFRSYLIDAAGQIQNLDTSGTVNYNGTVSGVKLDSTHMLLSTAQHRFRVAEVDANYIGSWSAAETSLSVGGVDTDNGVKMYIAGEDASYYYVIANRYSAATTSALSVVSVDKATWVVAQVGSDLTGMGNLDGYDMTPIPGYTNKWLCVYQNTNLKAIVVGVNGSFEPVLEGAEFDFGFVGDFPNVQSIDATRSVVTYTNPSTNGFAVTLEVNTGTWAVSLASAAGFEFETSNLLEYKTRLVKLDDNHVGILWGYSSSANYVAHQVQCKLAVLEMDAATYNLSESQGINLIAFEGSASSLSLLDSSTVVSTTIANNTGGSNQTANIQLWEVSAGSVTPTQVVITAAGVDFTAGASTTLEVQVQDAGGIVDGSDNTTQITFTPTSQGQITGVVTGTNISGTGAVGNPRVVQVAAGVAKITIENSTIETFEIATTNSAGLTNPANDSITTSVGAATKVVFTQDPTSAVAGVNFSPTITAEIQDAYNNVVNSSANLVLSINTGTGTLNGTTTVAAVAGVATFNNININEAGNFTLDVDSTGLATDTSPTFTISPAAAATVALAGPAFDFVAGASSAQQVEIKDAFGNTVTSDSTTHITYSPTLSGAVTAVAVGTNVSGTGLPGDPRTVQVAAGIAQITLEDTVAETFEVAFSNNQSLSNPANDSITVSAAAATKVSLTGAGSNFTVGGNTTVSVQVQDTYNNLITTDNTTQITYTPTSNGQIPSVSVGTNISGTGAVGNPRVVQVAGGQAAVVVTNLVIETFQIAFTNSGGYSDPANDSIDSLAVIVNGAGVMVGFNF